MFGDYSLGDLGSILAMQGFAGLILFSVYVLMALGLAIIFGQMGVINMAHGEFMILGAYVTWMTSNAFQHYLPSLFPGYFFVAMILAFIASGSLGMLVEWGLIRHLYRRPLDTLLATWGLSLILQQAYRSVFGAREVGVELPEWMMGSVAGDRHHPDSDQRHVRDGVDHPDHDCRRLCAVLVALGQAGARRGAEPRDGGRRRHQHREGRPSHLRPWLRHCRYRRKRLHHDRLDRADRRPALYRRHLPGRRVRRRSLACSAPSRPPSPSRRRSRPWSFSCRARWPRSSRYLRSSPS